MYTESTYLSEIKEKILCSKKTEKGSMLIKKTFSSYFDGMRTIKIACLKTRLSKHPT